MIFSFIFDSGKLGGIYGSVVFKHMLLGNELSQNESKMIISWGDIAIYKRFIDIEPYLIKDKYCTIDFDDLNSQNRFTDYPYCWVVEDLNDDLALQIDRRLKGTLNGYVGLSRIDPTSKSERKQFWKELIRSTSLFKKTITCFHNPEYSDVFCYLHESIELGYEVVYDPEAEISSVEEVESLQSSFIKRDEDLKIEKTEHQDIDRDMWTMNFALRKELQISGALIWQSINDIDKIQFTSHKENEILAEYPFLALYHAAQGIERIQKAIIELICKRDHISEVEKEKIYDLLHSHSHDALNDWIIRKCNIKFNSNCHKFIDIIRRFYNITRYSRYSDEKCELEDSSEYKLLLELSKSTDKDLNLKIKNNFGNYLGELANVYFKLYYELCGNLGIFAYELECESNACIVYRHIETSENLYKQFLQRKQAKKELLYWLIKKGAKHPNAKHVKEKPLDLNGDLIDEYLSELISSPESTQYLYDDVCNLYDELCSNNKELWKRRIELIDNIIANS